MGQTWHAKGSGARRRERVRVVHDRVELVHRRRLVRVNFAILELHLSLPVGQDLDDHARTVDVVPEFHSQCERVRTRDLLLNQACLCRMPIQFHRGFRKDGFRIRMIMSTRADPALQPHRAGCQRPCRERRGLLLGHVATLLAT